MEKKKKERKLGRKNERKKKKTKERKKEGMKQGKKERKKERKKETREERKKEKKKEKRKEGKNETRKGRKKERKKDWKKERMKKRKKGQLTQITLIKRFWFAVLGNSKNAATNSKPWQNNLKRCRRESSSVYQNNQNMAREHSIDPNTNVVSDSSQINAYFSNHRLSLLNRPNGQMHYTNFQRRHTNNRPRSWMNYLDLVSRITRSWMTVKVIIKCYLMLFQYRLQVDVLKIPITPVIIDEDQF